MTTHSEAGALLVYQHAIRRCAEPLTQRCNGPASPATVQRFIDHATGAAAVYARACVDAALAASQRKDRAA
jgi:hypothetical protein